MWLAGGGCSYIECRGVHVVILVVVVIRRYTKVIIDSFLLLIPTLPVLPLFGAAYFFVHFKTVCVL